MDTIKAVVAADFKVSVGDLVGPRRLGKHVEPRFVAVYLSREMTGLTTGTLGRLFGGRDHSTIFNAHRRVAQRRRVDFPFAMRVARLRVLVAADTAAKRLELQAR